MRGTVIHYVSDGWADLLKSHRRFMENGTEVPARFYGHRTGFFARLYPAWLVFTGQADAVVWPEDYMKIQPR
jgi:hypothetical protein